MVSPGKSSPKYPKIALWRFRAISGYIGASNNRHYVIVGQCATVLHGVLRSMLHRGLNTLLLAESVVGRSCRRGSRQHRFDHLDLKLESSALR